MITLHEAIQKAIRGEIQPGRALVFDQGDGTTGSVSVNPDGTLRIRIGTPEHGSIILNAVQEVKAQ